MIFHLRFVFTAVVASACTLFSAAGTAQAAWHVDQDDTWVQSLLDAHPERFGHLTDAPEDWRLQIAVGEIVREPDGAAMVTIHPYRLDAEYFYPASALKTIGAVAALITLESLQAVPDFVGLDVDTQVIFGALTSEHTDTAGDRVVVSEHEETTLRRQVERALIVSSNSAFNRLYDFAGHDAINRMMWERGLTSVRMRHRLSRQGVPDAAHRMSPSVHAALDTGPAELLPRRASTLPLTATGVAREQVGTAYRAPLSGEHVSEPMDFTEKNSVSLRDMLHIVAWVADPQLAPADLGLNASHRGLLREIMGTVPDASERFKPFSPGVTQVVPWDRLSYINKAGRAYGFHLDVAYVQDTETQREFLLAAAIYVNPDGILNNDNYAYDAVSYPFLTALGQTVAERLLAD